MTLREIIVDSVLSVIVKFTLLFAFAGLVLFSLRGLVKDDFESIWGSTNVAVIEGHQ
jgi:hypothetical protein